MKRLLITAAMAGLATTAHAAPEAFSHLDLTFIQSSSDNTDEDGDGIGVELNFRFGDSIFFNLDHTARNFDTPNSNQDADVKITDVGLGYALHFGETQNLSPYFSISLTELQNGGISNDGYTLAAGARFDLNDRLNIDGRYRQFSLDNADEDETAIRLSVSYALSSNFGLVLRYETFDESELDDIQFGVRALFGGGDE